MARYLAPTPQWQAGARYRHQTTSIGLADALSCLGVRVAAALREPSLGPCFGMKGGATGGGHAQVAPMEDIKLPDKIRMVAQEIYRAGAVQFSTAAKRKLAHFEKNGFGQLPVGTPTGFTLLERDAGLARARALWWRSAGTS